MSNPTPLRTFDCQALEVVGTPRNQLTESV
jgi:hypothetical protein